MAFSNLVSALRQAEQQLLKQAEGIRQAIASLEMGGAVSPAMRAAGKPVARKRRKLSAAARAAISRAQKARWAKQKAAEKK